MYENYYGAYDTRLWWHDVLHAPNGKGGIYYRSSQKKRRKMQRRNGKRR